MGLNYGVGPNRGVTTRSRFSSGRRLDTECTLTEPTIKRKRSEQLGSSVGDECILTEPALKTETFRATWALTGHRRSLREEHDGGSFLETRPNFNQKGLKVVGL